MPDRCDVKLAGDTAAMFAYLDDLRESGVTNMFGATPYLQEEFDLNKKDAGDVLVAWMNGFKAD